MTTDDGRSAADAASGHSPKGEASISVESSAKPSVPNAAEALQKLADDADAMAKLAENGPHSFTITWGRRAAPIPVQVREQGLLHWSPELRQCDQDADDLITLFERDLITKRALDRARDKLFDRAKEAVRNHAAAIIEYRRCEASAIEARSDATGTGAAEGESAVPKGDAQ